MGGQVSTSCAGYITILVAVLQALKAETLLKATELPPSHRNPQLCAKKCEYSSGKRFFIAVASRLEACMRAGDRCRLPASKAGRMWSAFHQFRVEPHLRVSWTSFLASIELPVSLHQHSVLALQLVVNRWLKKFISMKNEEHSQRVSGNRLSTLTLREQNIVYYMSGYISVKLIRRFKKKSPNKLVQQKRQIFVGVLKRMRAESQPDDIDTPEDYTRVWSAD